MQWFYDLRVAWKLGLSFLVVLALTTALGLFSILELRELNRVVKEVGSVWLPSTTILARIRKAANSYRRAELQHVVAQTDDEKTADEERMAIHLQELTREEAAFKAFLISSEARTLFDAFEGAWSEHVATSKTLVQLSRQKRHGEVNDLVRGRSKQELDKAQDVLDELIAISQRDGATASQRAEAIYASARELIVGVLFSCLLLGVGLAAFSARVIARPLATAVTASNRLALGEIDLPIEVPSKDESGQVLLAMQRKVRANRDMVSVAVAVAGGDLTVKVTPRSEKDALGNALVAMIERLSAIIRETRTGASALTSASTQVFSSAQTLSQGAGEQAASVTDATASLRPRRTSCRRRSGRSRGPWCRSTT
ncbi:MAG TPA: methyl-accepting chemotaxis protein [Polyangiaceae bacterium]|nr:methyl-accepting chemotaxis protein [Polyangiaceae bacterium]